MSAFLVLKNEHRVIEQVLNCLEKIAEEGVKGDKLNGEAAGQALEFFKNFADRCHHGKEEDHLFPMMEANGFPREGGPTGVMLYEHDLGRKHIQGMRSQLAAASAGNTEAVLQFAGHARDYVRLLRDHINKEDHCLFAMAERALSPDKQAELYAAFERVETEHMGEGTHERWLAVANALAEQYDVPRATETANHSGCCGHH